MLSKYGNISIESSNCMTRIEFDKFLESLNKLLEESSVIPKV